ncbi:hypothetical protein PR003_g1571 [Phytophthora rubi]|uniref:Uncharacterized protein n=1 Tax=Phytophthora rubi TaxID=129364 RepID=A0A6A4G743_9STRA|nr:hypothetical protein PR002_g14356 [Phytophthora rubi]KAE9357901.1 hypothetical protein PR003_g1571 [Phytophthora rubi]
MALSGVSVELQGVAAGVAFEAGVSVERLASSLHWRPLTLQSALVFQPQSSEQESPPPASPV